MQNNVTLKKGDVLYKRKGSFPKDTSCEMVRVTKDYPEKRTFGPRTSDMCSYEVMDNPNIHGACQIDMLYQSPEEMIEYLRTSLRKNSISWINTYGESIDCSFKSVVEDCEDMLRLMKHLESEVPEFKDGWTVEEREAISTLKAKVMDAINLMEDVATSTSLAVGRLVRQLKM